MSPDSRRNFVKKSLVASVLLAQPTILAGLVKASGGGDETTTGPETTVDPWETTGATTADPWETTAATTADPWETTANTTGDPWETTATTEFTETTATTDYTTEPVTTTPPILMSCTDVTETPASNLTFTLDGTTFTARAELTLEGIEKSDEKFPTAEYKITANIVRVGTGLTSPATKVLKFNASCHPVTGIIGQGATGGGEVVGQYQTSPNNKLYRLVGTPTIVSDGAYTNATKVKAKVVFAVNVQVKDSNGQWTNLAGSSASTATTSVTLQSENHQEP
ncbi:hypothetical protein [Luteolibacter sp. LG18]|uniref:hypothetical protein n=1 Tax=Luteolibacter sp. LG18 TaxID=2819286 RepID=UPI0030C6F767